MSMVKLQSKNDPKFSATVETTSSNTYKKTVRVSGFEMDTMTGVEQVYMKGIQRVLERSPAGHQRLHCASSAISGMQSVFHMLR